MSEITTTQDAKQKWIVIDTETSGLPNYKLPADDPSQPRLAELTVLVCDHDLVVQSTHTLKIKPDGWALDPQAAAINGLTLDILEEYGVPVRTALDFYVAHIDQGYAVLAYGAQFDCKILRGELRRAGIDDRFEKTKNFCVMRKSMGIVKKQGGKKGWPKLSDTCIHWNIEQGGHHTSLGDAMACLQAARKLRDIGVDLTPTVHFAKDKMADESPA